MMAATLDRDRDIASGATDAPHLPAVAKNVRGPGRASSRQRPLCEIRMDGKSRRGDDGGKSVGSSENDEETEDGSTVCTADEVGGDRARDMAEV